MKDETRQALAKIITTHGQHIAQDPRLCHAFLRDYCPWDDLEIKLLVTAVKSNVPAALRQVPPADLPQTNQRLAHALKSEHGHDLAHALWAIETWAIALKLMHPSKAGQGFQAPPRPRPAPATQRPNPATPAANQPNDPPPNWLPPTSTPAPAQNNNPTDLWGQTGFGVPTNPAPVDNPILSLFSFEGRISPSRFLWLAIPTGIIYPLFCLAALAITHLLVAQTLVTACLFLPLAAVMLPATWIFLAATAKRWHDMDITGWRALLIFTPPIVGHLFTLFIGGYIEGTTGNNRFGPPPID